MIRHRAAGVVGAGSRVAKINAGKMAFSAHQNNSFMLSFS
jgi:hypothetical protein